MDEEWAIIHHQQTSHMEELMAQRLQPNEQAEGETDADILSLTPPLWLPDSFSLSCAQCCRPFKALIRLRHHCRLCGLIFCASCSSQRCLLPPKFLEKEPQRCCILCQSLLAPVQAYLASNISQASKVPVFDSHDSISLRSYLNLPYHSNLEADLFKCSNILRSFTQGSRTALRPSSGSLLSIPATDSVLLVNDLSRSEPLYGLVILTSLRLGAGWSGSVGTGLVLRRRSREEGGGWSAPCAVALMGMGWGLQFGGEITDAVIALRSQDQLLALIDSEGSELSSPSLSSSVRVFGSLGGSMGVALGPMGRRADAALLSKGSKTLMKPLLSYSKSKGCYLGCSIEGSFLSIRTQVNQRFYGRRVTAFDLLHPANDRGVPPPPAASLLYDSLHSLAQKFELGLPPPSYLISPNSHGEAGPAIDSIPVGDPSSSEPLRLDAEASICDRPDGELGDEAPALTPEIIEDEQEDAEGGQQEVREEEIVWGFTSAWGCTPTLFSTSLPLLPTWGGGRADGAESGSDGEGTSVEGPPAVYPLSSSLDTTNIPLQVEPHLTSIHSIAKSDEEEEDVWNLFD
jgi:lipid-binding SYLF domain-containing protein